MRALEPIKVDHKGLEKAIQSGDAYIQVGEQKYLLMEVNEVYETDYYEVTDPEEERKLMKALYEDNPILSEEEINKLLGINK